ncbi:kinase [Paenibacillus campi]|uniref:GHMP family kinase ATP-binding protein n=1 Tax=Paenibacillus campi TaxID=3106031 RepID=UPI002AFDD81F|nr:kinase [Paenibacillus sp. SGZ-1014]
MSSYLEHKHAALLVGTGKSFGTFGELLQGVGSDQHHFLITLPINRYSQVTFRSLPDATELIVSPSHRLKSKQIAQKILERYGLPPGGWIEIDSNLPIGKGLASSSADIVATARAVDSCFQLNLSQSELEDLIREIEPTDGVMYEGIVSYYHREVRLRECLGPVPPLSIVSIDEGGEVSTAEFNKMSIRFEAEDRLEYDHLLDHISLALKQNDLLTVGRISTRSAILNQKLLHKQQLHDVLEICDTVKGLGIIITHSGTCSGILLDPGNAEYCRQLHQTYHLMNQLQGEVTIFHTYG